jgi:hypothetical protein
MQVGPDEKLTLFQNSNFCPNPGEQYSKGRARWKHSSSLKPVRFLYSDFEAKQQIFGEQIGIHDVSHGHFKPVIFALLI